MFSEKLDGFSEGLDGSFRPNRSVSVDGNSCLGALRLPGRWPDRHGFSLMELMVVIVVIGLLASVVSISVRSYMAAARRNAAKLVITKICEAVQMYYDNELKGYPPESEGLELLIKPTKKFSEGYLKGKLTDPWGRPYEYLVPGPGNEPFEVISYGADGREGGSGDSADVSSLDLKD